MDDNSTMRGIMKRSVKSEHSRSTVLEVEPKKSIPKINIGGSAGENVRFPQSLCHKNSSDYDIENCAENVVETGQ